MKIIFDLETSGLPITQGFSNFYPPNQLDKYDKSRMIEMSMMKIDNDKKIVSTLTCLIKPHGFFITNTNIHGISHRMAVDNGLSILNVLSQIENFIQNVDCLIAHNIEFDYNVLLSECYRYKATSLINKLLKMDKVCTMKLGFDLIKKEIDSKFHPFLKAPKLIDFHKFLYPDSNVQQLHRAEDDTQLCYECYSKLEEYG